MPWQAVTLTPGVNVEATPTLNQAGIIASQNIRFKAGLPQKLGGWLKYTPSLFAGGIKSLWGWLDLRNTKRLSVATGTSVTIVSDGIPAIVTPQKLETDVAPVVSSIAGSNVFTLTDIATNGLTLSDSVYFRTPVSIGGVILSGIYPIDTITGATSYTILGRENAMATTASPTLPVFTSTVGNSVISVLLADHGQVPRNPVVFDTPTMVGGVLVQGKYDVIAVQNSDNFTIAAATSASSAAVVTMNGGLLGRTYYIALGPVPAGVGYGLGGYGLGLYGLGTSGTSAQTGDPITAEDWTQDNWGEILLACPTNDAIYYWQPNTGFQNLAVINSGPLYNIGMFVSMAQQQVIAFGTSIDARDGGGIGIYQDPMLIGWCDIGNFFQWTPLAENFARNYRVPTGSKIIGGAASKNRNLIWTDLDLHAGTFNGGQSVYSWNRVGSNCGLIGLHAHCQQADTDYWMGVGNFFSYAGSGVQVIPCSVWDYVFQRIDPDFQYRVVAESNSDFTEIGFSFPVLGGGGRCDNFAKYNVVEGTWDIGTMDRCAWLDRSVLGNPLGASSQGLVYRHEAGFDDDNTPLLPSFETGDFYINEGEEFVFIDQVYPDFKWGTLGGAETAQVLITLLCRDAPGEPQRAYGPFLCTKDLPFFNPANPDGTRVRTRQCALRVQSFDVGSFWRGGKVRFRYSVDGRR